MRSWNQAYTHVLDKTSFTIPSVTVRTMTNDIFAEDDLLGRRDLSLSRITPAAQTATYTATTIVQALVYHWSLTFR